MKHFSSSVLQTILVASLAITVSACAVGPDYQKPETPVPAEWATQPNAEKSVKGEIDQNWWKNFNDPVLNQLIEQASNNNFDLKIAEARIAQARSTVSLREADLLPKGDVKGSATREANQIAFPGGTTAAMKKPFNLFQTGFDASWEVDLFGGNRRAEEAADATLQSSEASRDDVRVSLLAEVARTYVAIRQYQAQLATATNVVATNSKTAEIQRQLFDSGQSPQLDSTQAEA